MPLCRCSHRARQGGYTSDSDQRRGAPPASQPPPCPVANPAGSKCNRFSPHPRPPAQSNQAHRHLPRPVQLPPRLTTLIPRLYFPQNGHRVPVIIKSGYIPLCPEPSHDSQRTLGKKAQVLLTAHKALCDPPSHLPAVTSSYSLPCSLGSCHTGLFHVPQTQQEPSPPTAYTWPAGNSQSNSLLPTAIPNMKQLPSVTHHPAQFSILFLTGNFQFTDLS